MIRLDFDTIRYATWGRKERTALRNRMEAVAWHLGFQWAWPGTFMDRMSSGGGVHVFARVVGPLSPVALVAIQAILGSDPKRETFNLVRALVLDSAPMFWQSRWNVLYARKLLEDGMTINPDDFGKSKPTVKIAMFPGHDAVLLTLTGVEETTLAEGDTDIPKLILTFAEFPDHLYWPNVTSIRNLVAKLGNDETKWIGKRVALVRVKANNPKTRKQEDVLWVAEPDSEAWDARTAGRSRVTAGTTAGRGKKARK